MERYVEINGDIHVITDEKNESYREFIRELHCEISPRLKVYWIKYKLRLDELNCLHVIPVNRWGIFEEIIPCTAYNEGFLFLALLMQDEQKRFVPLKGSIYEGKSYEHIGTAKCQLNYMNLFKTGYKQRFRNLRKQIKKNQDHYFDGLDDIANHMMVEDSNYLAKIRHHHSYNPIIYNK